MRYSPGWRQFREWTATSGIVLIAVLCAMPASAQKILFHGADPGPTFGSDGAVFDFLEDKLGAGNVTYMQGDIAEPDGSSADGFDAVIISATLNSGTVRGKYAELELPVLNWEQALVRDEVGEFNLADGGATPGGQSEIDVIDNTHFITSGLDLGVVEVSDPETFSIGRGEVGAGVQVLANLVGVPEDHTIMVADKGAELLGDGSPGSPELAPDRRAFLFLQDNTFGVLNDTGLQIFNRTVDWLLRLDLDFTPGDFNDDGAIDLVDFNILASNFRAGTTFEQGDMNLDRQVDLRDFVEFRSIFNAQPEVAAVPEPVAAAWSTLLAGLLASLGTRRQRP